MGRLGRPGSIWGPGAQIWTRSSWPDGPRWAPLAAWAAQDGPLGCLLRSPKATQAGQMAPDGPAGASRLNLGPWGADLDQIWLDAAGWSVDLAGLDLGGSVRHSLAVSRNF